MKTFPGLSVLLMSVFGVSQTASAASIKWPSLSGTKYIKDRAANQEDVNAGRAVFAAVVNGKSVGKPIKMTIPQYAFHVEGKKKNPVVIIQAEEAKGDKLIGAIDLNGLGLAATLAEFELFGTDPKKLAK